MYKDNHMGGMWRYHTGPAVSIYIGQTFVNTHDVITRNVEELPINKSAEITKHKEGGPRPAIAAQVG